MHGKSCLDTTSLFCLCDISLSWDYTVYVVVVAYIFIRDEKSWLKCGYCTTFMYEVLPFGPFGVFVCRCFSLHVNCLLCNL